LPPAIENGWKSNVNQPRKGSLKHLWPSFAQQAGSPGCYRGEMGVLCDDDPYCSRALRNSRSGRPKRAPHRRHSLRELEIVLRRVLAVTGAVAELARRAAHEEREDQDADREHRRPGEGDVRAGDHGGLRRGAAGARVRDAVAGMDGVVDLKLESQVLVPQIRIRPRADDLARFGLTAGEVRRQAQTLIAAQKVGEIYRDQKAFDVAIWGEPSVRGNLHALRDLMILSPAGAPVRLRDVADVGIVPAPNEVKRENGQRRLDVTMNVSGADLGTVARQVEEAVAKLPFATGYHPQLLGEYAALKDARQRLMMIGAICLSGVLLLICIAFRSGRITALTGLSLPFALVGGVAAVALTGGVLSLGSLVGFVTVIGIAARNGIMLLSHYQHLLREERMVFGRDLALRGAEERLVPILMTAACAGLALVPLIAAGNAPGHEIEHPMAIVILGGLISSTVLNLFLMPALFARFGEERLGPSARPAVPA